MLQSIVYMQDDFLKALIKHTFLVKSKFLNILNTATVII